MEDLPSSWSSRGDGQQAEQGAGGNALEGRGEIGGILGARWGTAGAREGVGGLELGFGQGKIQAGAPCRGHRPFANAGAPAGRGRWFSAVTASSTKGHGVVVVERGGILELGHRGGGVAALAQLPAFAQEFADTGVALGVSSGRGGVGRQRGESSRVGRSATADGERRGAGVRRPGPPAHERDGDGCDEQDGPAEQGGGRRAAVRFHGSEVGERHARARLQRRGQGGWSRAARRRLPLARRARIAIHRLAIRI